MARIIDVDPYEAGAIAGGPGTLQFADGEADIGAGEESFDVAGSGGRALAKAEAATERERSFRGRCCLAEISHAIRPKQAVTRVRSSSLGPRSSHLEPDVRTKASSSRRGALRHDPYHI
jgi:hypothetical protein